jgi:NhaP-type Na+/H+ or K+/H+ antiporter
MASQLLTSLILVAALGTGAQWLAWRLRLPPVLLLIGAGLVVGPLLGWLDPARAFGDVLQPIIALGVALILFEGGITLRWSEYREAGVEVTRLVTVGLALTFALGSLAAHAIAGLGWPVALLFGAISVVTGPTVIMPLLRHARLRRRTASVLKWEGIINDPVGALLAVLVFEYFIASGVVASPWEGIGRLLLALLTATALGAAAAVGLARAFGRGRVPEYLKAPVLLVGVGLVYVLADQVQEEAGLVAVTVLGLVLSNRAIPDIDDLERFAERVSVLMLAALFVLLTANLDMDVLLRLHWTDLALLAAVIFLVRPLAVYAATAGSGMEPRERLFVAWIAPRGIVAAAMAGAFAPRLVQQGYVGAERLLPLVFALIIATGVLHGLTARGLARRLELASRKRHGVLIVGASPWSVALARALHSLEVPAILSDASWHHLRKARMSGVRVHHGQILSEHAQESLDLHEISHLLAVTANDAYNALVCSHFAL